jgi:predicted O-linked N-acetylglucosamine transferase (SPINDLY family)
MNNLIAIKHYANENIYKVVSSRNPELDKEELQRKIRIIFKQLINLIRDITNTNEMDKYNTPMAFLFQHMKTDIINLVANCLPDKEHQFIMQGIGGDLIYNLEWNIRFFNALITLGAKDVIMWFFLQIPYYNNSISNISKNRNLYEQLLDYFLNNWPSDFIITEEEFIFASNETCLPYAIAYHNQNNVNILSKYSTLIRHIAPWINYFSPRIAEAVLKGKIKPSITSGITSANVTCERKRRICFISDSFNTDSSVLRDRIGVIGKLDKGKFEIWIAGFNPIKTFRGILATSFIKKYSAQYVELGATIKEARARLETLKLDIIIYADLGMKLLPTLLAYSRLAPVQITTWGHSETSGIDTIDYYISSKWFECDSDESKQYYTEKLVLFNSLGTFYFSPRQIFIDNNPAVTQYKMKSRKELGLLTGFGEANVISGIYCCLQTFYKMTPEFEACIANILDIDRNGIVLLSNAFPYCQSHLARIKRIIGEDNIRRIRWFPGLEKDAFLNLVSVADVVLDPFPFGGCNTTFEAFDFNIPVITYPSDFLHGRFTYGLYKKMNMSDCECITQNAKEYAVMACKIVMNDRLRHKLNRAIEEGKKQIYQEKESIEEWNSFLDKVI